jgi:hydrogenase/urease accessory protein HupE
VQTALFFVKGWPRKPRARAARAPRLALLIAAVVLLATAAAAHPAPYSYLDLRLEQGRMEVALAAHVFDLAHDLNVTPAEALLDPAMAESKREAILNILRERLRLTADGRSLALESLTIEPRPDRNALVMNLRFGDAAPAGAIGIRLALFPYDPQHQTFLNIYEEGALSQQEILNQDHTSFEYFSGGRQGALAVVKKFVRAGIYHIFTGPDHILFIIGLLLLGGSLLRLLSIVTAFTIAHSVTLSLAALGVLNPPARYIEPVIALSIVYVGIDNLMVGKAGRDVRAYLAFFFGFVHGFGFASVLQEFGLPRQALGWSLFSFNFGVEIGQACIVLVVASALAALRNHNQPLGRRIVVFGSVGVILAGSYWFIQRVFF